MIPVVFINCRRHPFLHWIMRRMKTDETRSRDMLRALVGLRVLFAETGRGRPVVRCSAVIGSPIAVRSRRDWVRLRSRHRVPAGSPFDWMPWTKVKYLYPLIDVVPVPVPFTPPEGARHGRVWMEYNND